MSNTRGNTSGAIPIPVSRIRTTDLMPVLSGGEPDVPAAWRELHGVVQHIGEDLDEACAVAIDAESASPAARRSTCGGRRGERHDRFDRRGHQPREVVRLPPQHQSCSS